MHDNAALIAGGSIAAARAVAYGEVQRAVNFCGGLHHAMADSASGFCVYNDAALTAIRALLDAGIRKVAYIDIDAHHGDGVQAAFYDNPRVPTVSLHQTPLSLFPGTGFPAELGQGAAQGTSVNVAIDGQRTSYVALRDLAETVTDGRWVALGGGGYSPVRVVPRAWTHLLGIVAGRTWTRPEQFRKTWVAQAAKARPDVELPIDMNTRAQPGWCRSHDGKEPSK